MRSEGTMFNAKSVPGNLASLSTSDEEGIELPRHRAFSSNVRKLSKRLSSTFKSSFNFRSISSEEREATTPQKEDKKPLSKGLSLDTFSELDVFEERSSWQKQQPKKDLSQSTFEIRDKNCMDSLRRVVSFPADGSNNKQKLPAPPPSPYGKVENYTKLEQLGEGSYATVYKGISKVNNAVVALKEIRLQEEEGIPFTAIREASLLKGLNHSNIVRLHDIIPTKEHLLLVFEYLHTDLCLFLEERPFGLHAQNVKLLFFQLLRALQYIHEKSILHRDIKPQNVLLSVQGELKLADFGLARAKSVPSRTYTNEIVTLWYRPPDVLLGSTEYTTSLDIWGAGCIFVEMISGFPLFPGVKSAYDQLTKIFKVLGTPQRSDWPVIKKCAYNRDDFNSYLKEPLYHQTPRLRTQLYAEELAENMLQFDPNERITAKAAMRHPYFKTLPDLIYDIPDAVSVLSLPSLNLLDDHRRLEAGKTGKPRSKTSEGGGHYI